MKTAHHQKLIRRAFGGCQSGSIRTTLGLKGVDAVLEKMAARSTAVTEAISDSKNSPLPLG
ncbi:MAG: hypothetical protein HOL77_16310 [Rhodobacteraceae bacterium]|nr:hypothetical protein [Paracoccaceae bacterium]